MISLKNFVLGWFVGVVAISTSLAGNTVIGSYQATNGGKEAVEASGKDGAGTPLPIANANGGPGTNDPQFEKKLDETLSKNPEIIVRALQKHSQNQQRAQQERLDASLTKYKNEIANEAGAITFGKKDADTKFVVFLDPNCPHCRVFSQALLKIHERYPNVAILVRNWPILGQDSEDIVRGLWAIKQQGIDRFHAATKEIATTEGKYTYAKLLAWVKKHKLDVAKFEADSKGDTTKNVIEATRKLASEIGLEGTPTSILIDQKGIRLVLPTSETSLEGIFSSAGTKGAPSKS